MLAHRNVLLTRLPKLNQLAGGDLDGRLEQDVTALLRLDHLSPLEWMKGVVKKGVVIKFKLTIIITI